MGCKAWVDQELIFSTGEYICLFCGTITVLEIENLGGCDV